MNRNRAPDLFCIAESDFASEMILFTFKEVNDHFISRETKTVRNHTIFLSLSKGKISNLPARCGFVILHARYIPPIWFHGNTTLTKSIYPCPSYEVLTNFNNIKSMCQSISNGTESPEFLSVLRNSDQSAMVF